MAIISTFQRITKDRAGPLTTVDCGYCLVEKDNKAYLVLETYGSQTRAIPGKPSQAIHISRERAAELKAILADAFPGI